MARPTKQGLSYFPIDTNFDDKTELFVIENGAEGLGILITVWQLIYDNEGYYTNNGNDLYLLVKKRVFSDVNRIKDVINNAIERGIFNKPLHKKHGILTSKAIQKRYFEAARKKKIVQYDINHIINGINVSENAINTGINATNVKEDVNVKEDIEYRQLQFQKELKPYLSEYSKDMLNNFYLYWTEPSGKLHTKMRWELEKTWDLSRRLKRWHNNEQKWSKNGSIKRGITESELLELADEIANDPDLK